MPTEAPCDAMDVCVDRKGRSPHSEQQDDRRSLRPDAIQAQEPAARLLQGHIVQEIEGDCAFMFSDRSQNSLDPRGFRRRR